MAKFSYNVSVRIVRQEIFEENSHDYIVHTFYSILNSCPNVMDLYIRTKIIVSFTISTFPSEILFVSFKYHGIISSSVHSILMHEHRIKKKPNIMFRRTLYLVLPIRVTTK